MKSMQIGTLNDLHGGRVAKEPEKKPKIRSVKFNVVMNMILTSSSFLFPLITVPYVSRVLGPSGTGIVAWAQTFVSYFSLVALMGMNVYGVRECAKVRDDRIKLTQTARELIIILLVSTSLVYVTFLVSMVLIPKTRENIPLMLVFSVAIWLASCGMEWFYQAIEQYGYITVRNIALKMLGLILMFVFVRKPSDYIIYGATVVVGSYGSNVFNILRLRTYIDIFQRGTKSKLHLRRHFKSMSMFAVSSIASGMYSQIDMLLMGFFGSNVVLGLYQLVVKIKNLCATAVNSVSGVMLPRISYYEATGDHKKTVRLIGKNLNFLAIVSLMLISILIICSKPIILILGGPQYVEAQSALMLVSFVMLFSSTNLVLSQYMVAEGREKQYAVINVLGLIMGITAGCTLIPLLGINGAAVSVCIGEIVTLVIRCWVLRSLVKEVRPYLDFGRIFLCAIASFAVAACAAYYVMALNVIVQILIDFTVFALVYGLGLLMVHEKFIYSVLNRSK